MTAESYDWPKGTIIKAVHEDGWISGPYIVDDEGVPCFANSTPSLWWGNPDFRWEVVGRLFPEGHRAVPDEVCEFAANTLRHKAQMQRLPSEYLDELVRAADILDPPEPEPEYVTLDAGNGETWRPTVNRVDRMRKMYMNPMADIEDRANAHKWLPAIDAQLAEGKELRP